jgi:hypothetical protein
MTEMHASHNDMLVTTAAEAARQAHDEVRRRRGRPRGSVNVVTKGLAARVGRLMSDANLDMLESLSTVAEDRNEGLPTRLAALKLLFGAMVGRVIRPQ